MGEGGGGAGDALNDEFDDSLAPAPLAPMGSEEATDPHDLWGEAEDNGDIYYYNKVTGETTWDCPY